MVAGVATWPAGEEGGGGGRRRLYTHRQRGLAEDDLGHDLVARVISRDGFAEMGDGEIGDGWATGRLNARSNLLQVSEALYGPNTNWG